MKKKQAKGELIKAIDLALTFVNSNDAIHYMKHSRKGKLKIENNNGETRLKFQPEIKKGNDSRQLPIVKSIVNTINNSMVKMNEIRSKGKN